MKRRISIFFPVLLICILVSGCIRENTPPPTQSSIVTGITVTYENGPVQDKRWYTSSQKMRAILNYLRWIDPYGKPAEDPETLAGSSFRIILSYSDGREKQILQKADRYLWEEGKSWRQINPENALTLTKIIEDMPSDTQR